MQRKQKTLLYVCACMIIGSLLLHGIMKTWPKPRQKLPLPLKWQISWTGRRSDEVHHVFFVKIHKAASSTLTSLFLRFSHSRQLNVLLPRAGHNILSERERWPLALLSKHPPSPPFLFDMVCNHVVYDKRLERFLPEDVVRIAILREPLAQVYSAFKYYTTVYWERYLNKASSFHDFLSRQDHYEHRDPYSSFTNNRMSLDLDLPLKQLRNSSHVQHFVKEVDDLFDLVLIAERFDESMIVLKRRLKWTMKDVLYISINKGAKSKKILPKLDQSLEKKFRNFDQFDNGLYDYFSKKFDKLVLEGGQDFRDEVQAYRDILQRVNEYCTLKDVVPEKIVFSQQKYTDSFELQNSECKTMILEEMEFLERFRFSQEKRLYPNKQGQQ